MARSARVELILDTIKGVKGARDLSRETDRVAGSLAETAKQGDRAGRAVDDAGDEMSEAARAAAILDREVEKLTGSLREMAIAQALGGGNFAKQIREQETQIRRLSRNRKLFDDAGKDVGDQLGAAIGVSTSQGLFASLTTSFKAPPPPVLAAFAGLGLSLAPLLGAAVAGGIIGGAGIGGVVGGVVLASKDERVQAGAKALAASIGGRLQDAALPFVDKTLDGMAILEQGFNRVSGNVDRIMRNSSAFVRPLAEGVNDFLEPVIRGIDSLVAKASPVIEAIRRGLGEVGQAIGDLFTSLADNGVEAGMAIEVVFNGIAGVVRTVGAVINGLTEAFGFLVRMADKLGFLSDEGKEKLGGLRGATDAMTGAADAGKSSFGGFKAAIAETGTATGIATVKMRDYQAELYQVIDRNLGAAEATLNLRDAVKSAADAVDKKRRVSDAESRALIGMAKATNSSTMALDNQGRTVAEATRAHETNRKKLIEVAARMGYTRKEAVKLADQYLATPKNVNTTIKQPGMSTSQRETRDYDKQLDNLARRINTSITVTGDRTAGGKLDRLLIRQQALKKGISVSAAASAFNKNAYADGGRVMGPGTGTSDSIAARLSNDEYVIKAASARRIGYERLDYANQTGRMPGFATGGRVITAPFPVNAAVTKIMSLEDALSRVTPAIPSGGRTSDWIVRAAKALVPGIRVISQDRPGARTLSGNRSYHSMGRAVDFNPSRRLAELWNQHYKAATKELISPWNSLNIHNGARHTYTGAIYRQHSGSNAHDHIAMSRGGVVREPVFGYGLRSGSTYSFAERGPERVLPTGASGVTIGSVTIQIHGGAQSPEQIARAVERRLGRAVDLYARTGA